MSSDGILVGDGFGNTNDFPVGRQLAGWIVVQDRSTPTWRVEVLRRDTAMISDGHGALAQVIVKDGLLTLLRRSGLVRVDQVPTRQWASTRARIGRRLVLLRDDVLATEPIPRVQDGIVYGKTDLDFEHYAIHTRNVVFIGEPGSGRATLARRVATRLGAKLLDVDCREFNVASEEEASRAIQQTLGLACSGVLVLRNLDAVPPLAQRGVSRVAKLISDQRTVAWLGLFATASDPTALIGDWIGGRVHVRELHERHAELPWLVTVGVRRVHPLLAASIDLLEKCIGVWRGNIAGMFEALESAARRALRRKSHLVTADDLAVVEGACGLENLAGANDD